MSNADDPSITRVHELRRAHSSDLELEDHGWRECKCEPRRYVTDVETGSIRFDSIPTCDGSLEIEVARLPLRQLVSPEDCPEIPQQYHADRSEEHTSELQSLMRISYSVFCLKNTTIPNFSLLFFIFSFFLF